MYQIWPCLAVGQPGNYSVGKPGEFPVFVAGAYHWPKDEAQKIADGLNAPGIGDLFKTWIREHLTKIGELDHMPYAADLKSVVDQLEDHEAEALHRAFESTIRNSRLLD